MLFLLLAAVELGNFAALAEREEAGFGVGEELLPGVGNIEVAHGELPDAVAWGEGGFSLLHAEALGMEGEVWRLGVKDGVVVAAALLECDLAGDGSGDPALGGLAEHDCLGVEPTALIEQAAELAAIAAVLLDGVLVVDAGDEALVSNKEQGEARSLVDAAALGLDDSILNLVRHAQAVAAADAVGFAKKFDGVIELLAIEGGRETLFEANGDLFALDLDIIAPEGRAHDGDNDLDRRR